MIIEQAAEVLKIEAQGILDLIDRLGKALIQRDFFPVWLLHWLLKWKSNVCISGHGHSKILHSPVTNQIPRLYQRTFLGDSDNFFRRNR
ncbi:MAG: hypothetical protein KKA41_09310 [Proteobacteria bacterium]|nr:hypothetical protein [Pseudomonadota bacterium]MBU4054551.1 hypothetical protein [Pseudomonadota bacterium]